MSKEYEVGDIVVVVKPSYKLPYTHYHKVGTVGKVIDKMEVDLGGEIDGIASVYTVSNVNQDGDTQNHLAEGIKLVTEDETD